MSFAPGERGLALGEATLAEGVNKLPADKLLAGLLAVGVLGVLGFRLYS